MRVLDDAQVDAIITPSMAVAAARDSVLAAYRGKLVGPPRAHLAAGGSELVFTVGGLIDGPVGFRAYGLWPGGTDQVVAVWQPHGRLAGVVTGNGLGAYRTGALGAVALDALAARPLVTLALVGTGRQAWTQLWATSAVRRPDDVRVFGRDVARREAFARRASEELGLDVRAVGSAREAVEGAQSVILATSSGTPVVELEWLASATHVSTVGPKVTGRSELPLDFLRTSVEVVSDSPEQMTSLDDPFWNTVTPTHLGSTILNGAIAGAGVRTFASAGLAGSEVVLAERLLAAAE